ncbi:hypothetical protein BR93DRAFT_939399 [Coniochaeta sp. PMI_546]|nr:hypothetical protein BR93DRAFT_939399 [Coniochaeta sp. PMI_546]
MSPALGDPAPEADPFHSGADLTQLGHVSVPLVKAAQAVETLRMYDIPFIIQTDASNPFDEQAQANNLLSLLGQASPPVTGLENRVICTLPPFDPVVRRYADKTVLIISCDPVGARRLAWKAGLKVVWVHTDPDIGKAVRLGRIDAILVFDLPCHQTLKGQIDLIARTLEYNRESRVVFCNREYDRAGGYQDHCVTLDPKHFLEISDRFVQERLGTVPKYVLESDDPWKDDPWEDPPRGFLDICEAYRHKQFEVELKDVQRSIDDQQLELEKHLFPEAPERGPFNLDTIYFITNNPRSHYQELVGTQRSTIGARCCAMVVHDIEAQRPYRVPRPWDQHVPSMVYEDVMHAITLALETERFPIHQAHINGSRRD